MSRSKPKSLAKPDAFSIPHDHYVKFTFQPMLRSAPLAPFTAFYLRVSTDGQEADNQALELQQAGYEPTMVFKDVGVSGKVPALLRPAFADMLKTFERLNGGMRKRLVVAKVDRLGRDAADIGATVKHLHKLSVSVFVKQLGDTDLTSSAGKLILTVLAAVAEMERDLIVERTKAGLDQARAKGKKLGRPEALSDEEKKQARADLAEGASIRTVARKYGVAVGTIVKIRGLAP